MHHYVTLFDSHYLTRGLVLYRSMLRYAGDFRLWIICFDKRAYDLLRALDLECAELIPLEEFEDEELLRVKPNRTLQEYCWTSTPSVIRYVLRYNPSIDALTYLDADLMFFASPEPIFEEAQDASILLTEHRYHPRFDSSAERGIYNIQCMMFCRNAEGLNALEWWRERCLEWCFARVEDGKFGDQKYLDNWPERFSGVRILQHPGAGLAPWNVGNYRLQKAGEQVCVENAPLIFYHFHNFKLYFNRIAYLYSKYPLTPNLRKWIYRPYILEIQRARHDLQKVMQNLSQNTNSPKKTFRIPEFFKRPILWYRLASDVCQGRYTIFF